MPPTAVEQANLERTTSDCREILGKEAFAAAWEEGELLPIHQAVTIGVALAQEIKRVAPDDATRTTMAEAARAAPPAVSAGAAVSALTPREREIAVPVGRGYSNRRIAEALVIAEKTAEVHARNVRQKLGLSTRAQIAAWAAQHGLLADDA
jgi:DNA-binding NarL/FixJ family response regulator